MKTLTTYESFEELADALTSGEGMLHAANCAMNTGYDDPCMAWQHGVQSLAQWLDHLGIKVTITDDAENFHFFVAKQAGIEPQ